MAFKFAVILAVVAIASAVPVEYHHAVPVYHHQPATIIKTIAAPVLKHDVVDYDAPAKYDFSYGVHDAHTGDIKNQEESRDGHNVHGSYSLVDADGYKRTVEYTADEHNGFNAVVHREPLSHHHAPIAKVVAAPLVAKVAVAPATYDHYYH